MSMNKLPNIALKLVKSVIRQSNQVSQILALLSAEVNIFLPPFKEVQSFLFKFLKKTF